MFVKIKRLLGILSRWKWQYALAAILFVLAILVSSFEPRIIQIVVDRVVAPMLGQSAGEGDAIIRFLEGVLPAVDADNLGRLLLLFGGLYALLAALRSGLLFAANGVKTSSTEKAVKHLRDFLFAHIQRLPLSYFTSVSRGEIIQRSTGDIDTIRRFIHSQVLDLVRLTAIAVFSLGMMWLIDPLYALVSVLLTPLMVLVSFSFFKHERAVWEDHEAEADALNAIVQDNISGIRVVKAFANESYEIARFDRQNQRKLAIGMRHVKLHMFFWPLSDFLFWLQITLSIGAGGYFAVTGRISIGELIGFYSYIMMVSWPMRNIGKILSKMGTAMVAMSRIDEILNALQEAQDGHKSSTALKGEIEFRAVSFAYNPQNDKSVLKEVSFHIYPGERVALVGPTGSGKTTIVNLLLGLYDADRGSVFIDGRDIRTLSRRQLRRRIGVVLQTPFLFSTSVRENISYAHPEAGEAQVQAAADIARVSAFEHVLSDGFDTVVGEKGITLSGGQKQRVALARTLLTGPDVLVLDDVTSAVDNSTEQEILQGLEGPMSNRTSIIISHRLASLRYVDRILVLENGRITHDGTHEQLRNEAGYFQQIYAVQAGDESAPGNDPAEFGIGGQKNEE